MIIDSPIISGSQLSSGPLTQIGDVQISGSLTVSGSISGGTFSGSVSTASFAQNAANATTASYAATASGIAGGTDYYVPIWSGNNLITGSIYDSGYNDIGFFQRVSPNYGTFTMYAATEPRIYLSSSYNDYLAIYNSYGNSGIRYFGPTHTNSLLYYRGYDTRTLTIETDGDVRITVNRSGSVFFNSYTSSGLLKTAGSNGLITLATASIDYVDPTSYNALSSSYVTTSGSLSTRTTNLEATASTNTQASASFATMSGSLSTRVTNLESTSSTVSSSFASTSGSIAGRVTLIEGQYATTGSNNFTGAQYISNTTNPLTFTTTASLYTDGGLRVSKDAFISGTAYFNNVVVYGTSSIQYITSSQINVGANIINLNTQVPAQRYGGMAVADSGSNAGVTGSMLWDSVNNGWIYARESGSTYSGGALISGPRSSVQGSEQGTTACYIMAGQGGDHITSSMIYTDTNATCFYGNALYVSSSCNIGIGTSSPGLTLDVAGTGIRSQGSDARINSVSCDNGSYAGFSGYPATCLGGFHLLTPICGATSHVSTVSNYDTYLSTRYSNNLILATNNTERLRITNCGNVGIGTASPARILTVNSGNVSSRILLQNNCTGTTIGNGFDIVMGTDCIAQIWNYQVGALQFATSNNLRVNIDSTGISCFACTVCTPIIVSTANISVGAAYSTCGILSIYNGNGSTNCGLSGASIYLQAPTANQNVIRFGGAIATDLTFGRACNADAFYFGTTSGSEMMRITSGGRVGIGSNSPTFILDVQDATQAVTRVLDTTSNNSLILQAGTGAGMKITGYNYNTSTAVPLYISVDGANTIMQRSGGNVGIGCTAPAYKLTVVCTANGAYPFRIIGGDSNQSEMGFYMGNSGGSLGLTTSGDLSIFTSGADRIRIASTGITCFACQVCAPIFRAATAGNILNTSSTTGVGLVVYSPTSGNDVVLQLNRGGGSHKGSALYISSANYTDVGKQAFIEMNAGTYSGANTRYIYAYDNSGDDFVVYGDGTVYAGGSVCSTAFQTQRNSNSNNITVSGFFNAYPATLVGTLSGISTGTSAVAVAEYANLYAYAGDGLSSGIITAGTRASNNASTWTVVNNLYAANGTGGGGQTTPVMCWFSGALCIFIGGSNETVAKVSITYHQATFNLCI